ncbi:hypothetical protein [Pseudomonas aeruginosa]|uniref:hypothetical protein n=1 Tax=Pseudomonas aeruginosa TaxID=287 RepID=UPI003D2CDF55
MDFEDWKDEAANYLEDSGIAYSESLDDQLFLLWQSGLNPHDVVRAMSDKEAGQ